MTWRSPAGLGPADHPLSDGQRALWFLQRLQPTAAAWNIAAAARVRGGLDPSRLHLALEGLARRHEALRLGFHEEPEGPVQRLRSGEAVDFREEDAAGWDETQLRACLHTEAERPFDLARDPLMRVRLLRTGGDDVVLLVIHHLIADLGSIAVLVRELGPLYEGDGELPPPPVPYTVLVERQRERLEGKAGERHWAYWRERLAGPLPTCELPADRPRPARRSFRGGSRTRRIGSALADRLRRLAGEHRTGLFALLLAGFDALLQRGTGQSDLLVGSPTSGRLAPELESVVGYLVNPVVLRSDLSGSPSFRQLLDRVRGTVLGALRHQEHPFARLVERLQPDRDPARPPIFQVMLAFQRAHLPHLKETGDLGAFALGVAGARVRTGSLELESLSLERRFAQVDLELMAAESSGGLELALTFDADLFDPTTAERLLVHLETLLAGAAADQDRRVGELPLLSPAQRRQLLRPNQSCAPLPGRRVHELVRDQAARTPEAIAVSAPDGILNYRELRERGERVARALLASGLRPEEPVAVRAERGAFLVAALLGILEAGGVYLPLAADQPEARLSLILERSGARIVLTPDTPLQGTAQLPDIPEEALAYLLFTSGSTGEPKGVQVPHRGLLNHLLAKLHDLGLTASDRVAQTASPGFDISIWQLLAPLLAGATVEVVPDAVVRDPGRLLTEISDRGITVLELVPSALAPLVDEIERSGWRSSGLRWLISTGEALPPELARRWLTLETEAGLVNGYGPTECADRVSHAFLRSAPAGATHVSIGRPIPNLRLHVLSADLQEQPAGFPGEVCIAGIGVGRGYLDDPARTAAAFLPDPFGAEPGGRLYCTGDLGRRCTDGEIEVLGRLDHQVKLRGVRIEPGEVEAVLLAHPGVREAVVAARGGRLMAWWAGDPSAAQELRDHLRERLPDVMVPAVLQRLEALPLTPHGKVDRRALPDPEPDAGRDALPDDLEPLLAGIFAAVLGRERVGAHERFFELGGHSLLAAQAVARVWDALGIEPPVGLLFEEPSAAGLARRLRELQREAARLPPAPPLRPMPGEGRIPLSFAQQRLWFLHRLDPESPAYNMPGLVRVPRPVSPPALAASLAAVAARHETLRTTFPEADGEPYQEIAPGVEIPVPLVDLTGLPGPAAEAERLAFEEARRPFDLAHGPLLRSLLLRLGPADHRLVVSLHHIAGDGWSQEILLREASALYRGNATLTALPVQYKDYALWQRLWMEGEGFLAQLAWWKGELSGSLPPLALPLDRPRPPRPRHRGARLPVRIDPGATRELRRLARQAGATPFMAVLAVFQTLLHRLSGQEDVRVGSPVANRRQVEVEGLIGVFANTLVLRTRFGTAEGLRGLLERVRRTALGVYTHQDLPYERLVDELGEPGRAPLFQALLAFQAPAETAFPVEEIDNGTAKFDLSLSLRETEDRLDGWIEHDTDLLDSATVARWAASFLTLLEAGTADPSQPVAELPVLGPEERSQLLAEWNDTRAPIPDVCVHHLFEARVARTPDVVAVRFRDESLTYAELDAQASRLARRLARLGAGPETAVGLLAQRSLELMVGLLGILKAGASWVPLDPAFPQERLDRMVEDSGALLVLTCERIREELAADPGDIPPSPALPESLAYTIFTSGSTGRPKGVQVTHRSLVNFLASMAERPGLRPDDVLLAVTTLAFDIAALELLLPLTVGARVVVVEREAAADGARLAAEIERAGATVLQATPATWRLLLESGWTGSPGLTALCGGEALPRELARALLDRTAGLWNLYGPTETTVWSSVHPVLETERTVPIGRPIANTAIHLVDRNLQPVPAGVPGELLLGGAGLARGYAGRPDLTAERFVPDPFGGPGERLYRTGDLARRLPDGRLEVLGRLDQQVKLRGFRIELEEIEAALEAHPAVTRAVAAVREVAGDLRLVSWIVPATTDVDLQELRESLARRLPELMIPSLFALVDELPLTPNGKVDRRALPDPAPMPEAGDAPEGPIEEAVAEIWAGVLGLERVGRHRSFFELGGHSLLATRAMARINEAFLTQLPLRALFEAPTVAGLARLVANLRRARRRKRPPAPPFRRVHRGEPLAPSFAQERLWFMDRLTPGNPVYNVSQALDLDGFLDEPALARAFAEVVRRHEALRTRFTTVQGRPMQVVEPVRPRTGCLAVIDLRRLPPRLRAAEADRLAAAEARRPFDLGRGPLLRTALLRLAEGSRRLLVTLHHVVCDDWSVGLLAREVGALYRGQALPDLLFQYADYADWQRRWLGSEALEVELEFWRARLGGELPVLDLPADRPRPALQTFRGAAFPLAVPAPLTSALRELSLRQGVTLFMTLLAAFAAVLHRAAGQDDLIVGTPVAGRVRRETEGLIGCFVNVLPLRLDLSGQPGWSGLLARVRTTALEAYDHQDLPFEKLVEALHPKRDLGRAAVRQAGFAYQDANPAGRHLADLPGGAGGLLVREVPVDPGVSRLDLTLFLRPSEDALAGVLEHSTDLFDPATAHRLGKAFLEALEDLAAGAERPLPALASVAARELRSRAPETNLTAGQLLFWFAHKLHPETRLYFDRATATFTLEGELDPASFARAFERLLASCDVLRSRVREVGGVPWRSVAEPAPFALEVIDLAEEDLPGWLAERCARPMDLEDRLFDTALVRLGPSRQVWFLSVHHLVADAWTLELLARRLSELVTTSQTPPFPSYEEYVSAERGRRARADRDGKLSQPVPTLLLYGRTGSPAGTRTARLSVDLDAETSAAARATAHRLGLFSPAVVFAATFFALLHRLSGEDRLRVGAPFANRPARFRGTPGLMMSAVPLDVQIAAGETFASLADRVQQETVEAARHPAHPARAWEVYFNYQSAVFRELCGLPVRFELQHSGHSLDRLTLQVSDFAGTGRFRLDLDFHLDSFDADQRERTRDHFLTLLHAFLADPGLALRDAPLLSPAERARLARFNDTAAPYPRGLRGLGLHHLVEAQTGRTPDAVAVVFEGREMTYRELGERADRLAARLRSEDTALVGVRLDRSLELMVALVGILKAGAAYVPLDPGYPADRLALMTEDSGVALLLDRNTDLDAPAVDPGPRPFDEADLAYVIYTSGSTGRPKGVMIPHAGICNRLLWMQEAYGLTPADRVLQKTPISFDVSVWELFWPLVAGARVVLARPGGHQDPAYLVSTIVREGITTVHFVPSMLQAFLEQPGVERCTGLARVICSGEALPEPLRRRFHERLPGVELHNLYGPTEASVDVTAWRSAPQDRLPSVPIGRPIANTRVHLLDADGNLVPPGLPGELCLGGVALARGYLGRPDLTAERFVPDPSPVEPGDRLYRTGDLARWLPDGDLEFLGRIDGQVKLRGVRIEPGEIESLMVQLPGVREAVVQVREDRPGDRRLIAWYVPEPGRDPSPGRLREELRARLPEVMVPSACVPLNALPLTPSGKVDRRSLTAPETATVAEQPARTLVESLVAGICAEVLGVDDVPVDASFFDLGGNSLMATQVVNLLQEVLPVEIDLRKVFEAPTVAHLAEVVEEERRALPEVKQHAMAEILAQLERDLDGLRQGLR